MSIPADVLIDDEDRARFDQFTWHVSKTKPGRIYVKRSFRVGGRRKSCWYLHRVIMDAAPGEYVDHINGNPLDNRRANLRKGTQSANLQNRHILQSTNTSGLRGVGWDSRRSKWRVQVKLNRKNHFLGYYDDVHEAGRVVAEWRREHMPFSEMDKVAV
jgi:hypothetical protein